MKDGVATGDQAAFLGWAKAQTDGYGVDCLLDCLPPGAPAAAMMRALFALRRGGRAANVGAVMDVLPLNALWLMTNRISLQGSVWFTTGEGEEMAAMASAGTLDVSALEHKTSPLSRINEAIAGMDERAGGFTNFIDPARVN
jgi:alcohol dehydrogenase